MMRVFLRKAKYDYYTQKMKAMYINYFSLTIKVNEIYHCINLNVL